MQEPDYKAILTAVGLAWRIVVAYQQRVFFLLDEIEAGFPELTHSYWSPAYYSGPPKGSTKPSSKGKWTWDGFPYYSMDTWLTLPSQKSTSALDSGDWFAVIRIDADSGFDVTDVGQKSAFSGPDPLRMLPASETKSELRLYVCQVIEISGVGKTPSKLWSEDDDDDAEFGCWDDVPSLGIRRISWCASLEDLLAESGTSDFIKSIRAVLKESGIPLMER